MCIIVLYVLYIIYYIHKFDNNKITGAFRPKAVHCDFAVGALRLGSRGIATRFGAFQSGGIQAEGHSDYNSYQRHAQAEINTVSRFLIMARRIVK